MDRLKDMKWELLGSEYLIRRPWLTARRDTVRLPDGRVNDEYYVLEYPDWVNVIAITRDGRFVLVRQYRHGAGRTSFELCAGVCEEGESPEESARRELLEETGFAGGEWRQLMSLSANASTHTNTTWCFLATGVEKVAGQHLDATEDVEVHLLMRDEVVAMLRRGEFVQALMAAPLWRYFACGDNNPG
ncbi:MAG: NUDIX hydrolase [Prevotella sp.]